MQMSTPTAGFIYQTGRPENGRQSRHENVRQGVNTENGRQFCLTLKIADKNTEFGRQALIPSFFIKYF